ncbi:MAG TPA: cytochrome c [Bryobacteraceae bacterium]|jgi:cytochrome c oxidase cbb3-type subunit 3|nr:cytochrome c [Bryobacteraceae bacterium]
MRTICIAFFALLWLASSLPAQDPDDVRQPLADSTKVDAGKAQFQQTCGFCHGRDARGASGPDLIRSPLVSHDVNGNLIGPVIRSGRPEKGMPPFPLSDSEIHNIAEFLHAEAKVAGSVARRIPSEYPLAKLLVGNADAGRAYFEGQGNCRSCHSTNGDLAHVASKYKPFDLQTRIAFPSGANPSLKVTDSAGNVFTGEQVYADEFLVSLRDKSGWLHTWKRNLVQVEVHDPLAEHERLLKRYTDADLHNLFAYLETLK